LGWWRIVSKIADNLVSTVGVDESLPGELAARSSRTSQIDIHVGKRVRQRREALGVSQSLLGRRLGLTFSQVQKYEKGTNRIGAGRLYVLAQLLGVNVHYFFDGLDAKADAPSLNGGVTGTGTDSVALCNAIDAIPDSDKRQAILSLVFSLAGVEDSATDHHLRHDRHASR
jgi:transcriptional regulator with XRE-family HTH domain